MLKKKKMTKYYIAAVLVAAAVIGGIGSQFFLGPDNIIEEAAEKIIEQKTGIALDLSPSLQENFHRGRV